MANPNCPKCEFPSYKHDFRNGIQRYRCKSCGNTFTLSGLPQGKTRNQIGNRPMTNAERQKRYQERVKKRFE